MHLDGPPPHVFALPPGVDFTRALARGLSERLGDAAPEDWAAVTILVNTARMRRRLIEVFDDGPARLLPRIRLITDLALDPLASPLPLPGNPVTRRLDLAALIARLLDASPDLAPRTALFDLAESLSALIDEMQGEGVVPETIAALDVTDLSGHWARSLTFLRAVTPLFDPDQAPGREARQRDAILRLTAHWAKVPPPGPVLVAGSTGSRGATALLLAAVAQLPEGAVILPGFDTAMPPEVWDSLDEAVAAEDHPQFRFHRLLQRLKLEPAEVKPWCNAAPANPQRNRLISLALRPAPVTDQWLRDGPTLGDLTEATEGLVLLEAPTPRAEAETIALRLRAAIDEGRTAALISPDRILTRQVTAALDRWSIVPDDSAGVPLALTPPGRFLRQVAALMGERLTAETLLSLLKHPLCHSGAERGPHLRRTRELELMLRRDGPPYPDPAALDRFAARGPEGEARQIWANWLKKTLFQLNQPNPLPFAQMMRRLIESAEALAAGPPGPGSGVLWEEAAGRTARALCDDLAGQSTALTLDPVDFAAFLSGSLSRGEVRNPDPAHPQIRIWGTLEARVQGADLVILAGLNEGVWPESPPPDPWLNRAMRRAAGLLMPERQIGLSAHDFVQAAAGPEVWLSRALRNDEAETIPSRWINRLTGLLQGLPAQGGDRALAAMRARATLWQEQAVALNRPAAPVARARRPSPRVPAEARPRQLSVTDVGRLLRDPYSVYAGRVLRLRRLDPLTAGPDAPLRGTLLHEVLETVIREAPEVVPTADRFIEIAREVLARDCPWPMVRRIWLGRFERALPRLLRGEAERRALASPAFFEQKATIEVTPTGITLIAKADRIDLAPDGTAVVLDYKTGKPPTAKQMATLDKQLLIECAMVERGAFPMGPRSVSGASYIALGPNDKDEVAPLDAHPPAEVWAQLIRFLTNWNDPTRGYTARAALVRMDTESDFDHLARLGEWEISDAPSPEDLA